MSLGRVHLTQISDELTHATNSYSLIRPPICERPLQRFLDFRADYGCLNTQRRDVIEQRVVRRKARNKVELKRSSAIEVIEQTNPTSSET